MTELDDEARAAGRVAGEALSGLARAVESGHRDVSAVVDRAVPEGLRPLRPLTRQLTRGVYQAVAAGARTLPPVLAEAGVLLGRARLVAPSTTAGGRTVTAAVNGLWSALVDEHPTLTVRMAVRHHHTDLALEPAEVAAAFPDATPHVAVLVHGLAQDEDCWVRRPGGYPERLRDELGITPVLLRYSTGRSVATNAEELVDLLDRLVMAWPVPVERLDLVGHSMGGLVAVSAALQSVAEDRAWGRWLEQVVTLGTPHDGAPLARLLRLGGEHLPGVPVVGPVVDWAAVRTSGMADLTGSPYPPLPTADEPVLAVHTVTATLRGGADHPLAALLGDGLVTVASARGHRLARCTVDSVHVTGVGHLRLLNDPQVFEVLAERLTAR